MGYVIRKPMRKFLCAFTLCAVCMAAAFSQGQNTECVAARVEKGKGMSQKDAEAMAQTVFKDELRAGKLNLQQAADYCKCAHDDYAERFHRSASGKKYAKTLARLANSESESARKQQQAKLDQLIPKLNKQMDQAEGHCVKKLNLEVTRGKVFGRARRFNHS